jgi:Tyosinase C-terminal domain
MVLNGPFTISYFVLQNPQSTIPGSSDIVVDPHLVGVTHIFASPAESCAHCADQADKHLMIRNTVPFTSQLLDYVAIGDLRSMEPDDVLGFLKGRLRWRISKGDTGANVDPRSVSSLEIRVSAKKTVLDGNGKPTAQVDYFEYPQLIVDIIANASAQAGHLST